MYSNSLAAIEEHNAERRAQTQSASILKHAASAAFKLQSDQRPTTLNKVM